MKKFLVAALLAALSVAGLDNTAQAQTKVKGKVVPQRIVTRRVVTTETTPSYRVIEHRYYQPFTGYRRVMLNNNDEFLSSDVLIRNGVEYRRMWVPGYLGDDDQWISGHYEWTHTEE